MPSMTKLALSALALFASVDAAPLLSGLGKTSTAATATSDLKVFVDAFVCPLSSCLNPMFPADRVSSRRPLEVNTITAMMSILALSLA